MTFQQIKTTELAWQVVSFHDALHWSFATMHHNILMLSKSLHPLNIFVSSISLWYLFYTLFNEWTSESSNIWMEYLGQCEGYSYSDFLLEHWLLMLLYDVRSLKQVWHHFKWSNLPFMLHMSYIYHHDFSTLVDHSRTYLMKLAL